MAIRRIAASLPLVMQTPNALVSHLAHPKKRPSIRRLQQPVCINASRTIQPPWFTGCRKNGKAKGIEILSGIADP
jgi:hypothetical protein